MRSRNSEPWGDSKYRTSRCSFCTLRKTDSGRVTPRHDQWTCGDLSFGLRQPLLPSGHQNALTPASTACHRKLVSPHIYTGGGSNPDLVRLLFRFSFRLEGGG
jgi:hypothetical protein